ncbi:hypothetical protein [Kitasatospora griseola]|uniref:hypothetical protein n=1 Tax=Kitasatospora griseola TaxID=2064 RepID=UPI003807FD61
MKAAVVRDSAPPLVVEDRPVPAPGPHRVLVRPEACGLRRTGTPAARGDRPAEPGPAGHAVGPSGAAS